MSKNPIINALSAAGYIGLVVSVINLISVTHRSKPDTAFAPVAFLSLFTLSAAIMGYIFLYQPLMLFLDGHKKNAINLFLQTVGVFAGITAVVFVLLFLGVLK